MITNKPYLGDKTITDVKGINKEEKYPISKGICFITPYSNKQGGLRKDSSVLLSFSRYAIHNLYMRKTLNKVIS